jgi:protein-disulfide isomerase
MKKCILAIVCLSVIGAAVSIMLMYQHFFPHSDFAAAVCGSGLDNPCAILGRSGYGVLFGLPLAGYALIGYFILFITGSMALAAGDSWYIPCFGLQVPVAVASVMVDIILGSILLYLRISCPLCIVTYVVNILICVSLFIWFMAIKDQGTGLRSIYRGLISLARGHRNRPAALGIFFITLFMVLFVFSLSAYFEIKGGASEPSAVEMQLFEERYFSTAQEDLSLPESAMSVGNPSARIRIALFTDFLCGACMKFHEVEGLLLSRFKGQVRVDYYCFPLDRVCNDHIPKTTYANSCIAAQAFSLAAQRGIFRDCLEHHYAHYRENLPKLRSGDVMVGFKEYFRKNRSVEEYNGFLQEALSEKARQSIRDDMELGAKLNVRAVPTLFVNGRRLEGVPDKKLLEYALSRELGEK